MIELKDTTSNNLSDVLNLSVFEYQESFVSSATYSLAQAYVYRETAFPFAVYLDNIVIGFIMFGYFQSKQQYTLWKFLIDKEYQNNGYGQVALKLGIEYLKDNFKANRVYTGVAPDNEVAKHLYSSFGFVETGVVEDGMIEMCYEVPSA